MNNPNDASADIYDIVSSRFKGKEVTGAEIDLITNSCPIPAKVLDVGCGTGRHAIPLAKLGYKVTGIDSSALMLEQLKAKNPQIETHLIDTSTSNWSELIDKDYDLIILMWNAFNEIALTETTATTHLSTLKKLLSKSGKILINIDDRANMNLPQQLNFHYNLENDSSEYSYECTVVNYDAANYTTTCREKITVITAGQPTRETDALIVQRWWDAKELQGLAEALELKFEYLHIKPNAEAYLVLSAQ
jgi:SAM-dependent methyltransferase